jgi:hypothetical protein
VPPNGYIKINVDGAYSEQEGGLGVMIRDHRGKVLLSAWKILSRASSAEEVEACVCRDWIAALLHTSSRVLVNGAPNEPIQHGRGLRQGDPLSPLLFVVAIEPLRGLLQVATEQGLLSKLQGRNL